MAQDKSKAVDTTPYADGVWVTSNWSIRNHEGSETIVKVRSEITGDEFYCTRKEFTGMMKERKFNDDFRVPPAEEAAAEEEPEAPAASGGIKTPLMDF